MLEIRTRPGVDIEPTAGVRYRVTTPTLARLELRGAGTITAGSWHTERFRVRLQGAGDIVVPGAGSVRIAGEAAGLDVSVPGAGTFQAGDLRTTRARVEVAGMDGATLWVTDELHAEAPGLGWISVYGDPVVSGSAGVQMLGGR